MSIPIRTSIRMMFNDFFVSVQYKSIIFLSEYPFFIPMKVKNNRDAVSPYPKNILFKTLNTNINKVNKIPAAINIKFHSPINISLFYIVALTAGKLLYNLTIRCSKIIRVIFGNTTDKLKWSKSIETTATVFA